MLTRSLRSGNCVDDFCRVTRRNSQPRDRGDFFFLNRFSADSLWSDFLFTYMFGSSGLLCVPIHCRAKLGTSVLHGCSRTAGTLYAPPPFPSFRSLSKENSSLAAFFPLRGTEEEEGGGHVTWHAFKLQRQRIARGVSTHHHHQGRKKERVREVYCVRSSPVELPKELWMCLCRFVLFGFATL